MASTSLFNPWYRSCDFTISGLGLDFNSSNYLEVGVAASPITSGSSSISGRKGYVTPPASGTSRSVTGSANYLEYNATQTLYGYGKTLDGLYYPAGSDSITTLELYPPTNVNVSVNEKDITVTFTKASGASITRIDKYWISGTDDGTTSGTSFSFTVPNYSTSYSFDLQSETSDGLAVRSDWTAPINFTSGDSPAPPRPSNWSWSYNISSGGSVYNTVFSGGQIIAYIMPYTEWNNFTSRINEFRNYLGLSTYSFTPVSPEGDCTKSIINEAVNAINAMGFSISGVSSEEVPAQVFIDMRDSINSIN